LVAPKAVPPSHQEAEEVPAPTYYERDDYEGVGHSSTFPIEPQWCILEFLWKAWPMILFSVISATACLLSFYLGRKWGRWHTLYELTKAYKKDKAAVLEVMEKAAKLL
jgi:hypothetical protein